MVDKSEASWADTSSCFASGRESSAQSVPAPTTNRTVPPSSSAKCLIVISRRKDRAPTLQVATGSLMQLLDLRHKILLNSIQHSQSAFRPSHCNQQKPLNRNG